MYLVDLLISLLIFGFIQLLLYMSLRYKLRHRYRACFGLLLCILAIRVPWYSLLSPYQIDAAIAMSTLMLGGIWFIITMD
ncbi:hypothetical protein AWM79_04275 [Pseudomonas agarici]|uniref:Uncharacterized protein n=1 Tax=Pseudomonas agarici TaxID=46677 RepID=A0A0X1SYG4_PSEAA|nr:hypothetical protein [Pseudomonas agarici]AMB84569.1 hypothetical protein AWM79_04275 [Pseudomonas agarici]